MRKILLVGLALLLSGCVSYGYYGAEYRPLPEYSCYTTPSQVICYSNVTNRMSYYGRGHYLYNYWYSYSLMNRRYVPIRSGTPDRRGVATPNGYRNTNNRKPRVAVPRNTPKPRVAPPVRSVPPRSAPTPTVRKPKAKRRTGGGGQ